MLPFAGEATNPPTVLTSDLISSVLDDSLSEPERLFHLVTDRIGHQPIMRDWKRRGRARDLRR